MRRIAAIAAITVALVIGISVPAGGAVPDGPGGRSIRWPLTVTFDGAHLAGTDTQLYVSRLLVSREHPSFDTSAGLAALLASDVSRLASSITPVPVGKDSKQVWNVDTSVDNYAAALVCVGPVGGRVDRAAASCEPFVFHLSAGDPAFVAWHLWNPLDGSWNRIRYGWEFGPLTQVGSTLVVTYASSAAELSVMALP